MKKFLEHIHVSILYLGFFGLIAFAIYLTRSASPLWALLLTPSYNYKGDKKDHECPSCGLVFVDKDRNDDDEG